MRIFYLTTALLCSTSVVIAQETEDIFVTTEKVDAKTKPINCLYTKGYSHRTTWDGRTVTKSGQGVVSSASCAEMNLGARVNGVCIFNDEQSVWQRGNWNPNPKSGDKFTAGGVCDQGVEVVDIPTPEGKFGPRFHDVYRSYLDKKLDTKFMTSNIADIPGIVEVNPTAMPETDRFAVIKGKIPAVCYKSQDVVTQASLEPVLCEQNADEKHYCQLRYLKNVKLGPRKVSGYWWIQFGSSSMKKAYPCWGGVALRDAVSGENGDPLYAKVKNTVADGNSYPAKYCFRDIKVNNKWVTSQIKCVPTPADSKIGVLNSCFHEKTASAKRNFVSKVYALVKQKYPEDLKSVQPTRPESRKHSIFDRLYNRADEAKVLAWTPPVNLGQDDQPIPRDQDPEWAEFNQLEREYNDSAIWTQVTKVNKHGVVVEQLPCKEVLVEMPRTERVAE